MATVLDELVVRLGLDGAAFNSQVQQTQGALTKTGITARREASSLEEYLKKTHAETSRRMKQTAEVGQQVGQQFSNLKNHVLGFLGAIAGAYGIQQFVSNIVHADAALGAFSKTLGIDPAIVGTWEEMAKRVGSSVEAMRSAFVAVSSIQQEYQLTGRSERGARLAQGLGVSFVGEGGKLRPIEDVLKEIGEKAKSHPPAQMRELLGGIFDPSILPLLMKGREELEKMEKQYRALGVATAKSAEEDQNFLNQLSDLQQMLKDIGRTIFGDLYPYLMDAAKATKEWLQANKEWLATKIKEGIQDTVWVIKQVATEVEKVVKFFGDWKTAAEVVLGIWAASKVLPILTFFLQLGTAVWGVSRGLTAMGVAMAAMSVPAALTSFLATLTKLLPALAALGFIGAAGGEDEEFSKGKTDEYLKNKYGNDYKNNPEYQRLRGGSSNRFAPTADVEMQPHRRAFLDALSIGESGGDYNAYNDASKAAGRYQFLPSTNAEVSGQTGLPGMDPVSQDRKAWFYAAKMYRRNTGRDLDDDLRSGGHEADIASGLNKVWTSLPGGPESHTNMQQWMARMHDPANYGQGQPQIGGPPPTAVPPPLPVPPIPPPAAAAATTNDNRRNSSVETHVNGPINVHTNATDADGIARGIGGALQRYAYVPQVNVGLA